VWRGLATAAVDLLCGAVILGVAFAGTRTLLQGPRRAYLLVPVLSAAAWALGRWRGRAGARPRWIAVALLCTPLALAHSAWHSPRDRALFALLGVALAFASLGAFVTRARPSAALLAAGNLALATLVPTFVGALVQSRRVSEPSPPFELHLADGTTVGSQQLRGRVVVVDLWATWCMPCRRELPLVDRVARRMRDAPDVAFYAVDTAITDQPGAVGDTLEAARAFHRRLGLELPLAFSADGKLETALAVRGLPALVVLDRAGRIRLRHVGFVGAEDLEADLAREIERLRAEPAG
jgi:thiol-disulfide isomerase/thioredoxin